MIELRERPQSTDTTPHWRVAGASIRGVSHDKRGQPCQDAHVWREIPGGAAVIAVADGAGSASLSQLGSARAALAAADWVTELMTEKYPTTLKEWRAMLIASLQTAHESVFAVARRRRVNPRELATTLIVLVVMPEFAAAVQVGDGAAIVMDAEQNLTALTAPQTGEYINETTFFTSPYYLEAAQFGVFNGPLSGAAAISDGLQLLALKMPDAVPHPAFFRPLFNLVASSGDRRRAQEQLGAFLQSDRIKQRADDDLTLVLATLDTPNTGTPDAV